MSDGATRVWPCVECGGAMTAARARCLRCEARAGAGSDGLAGFPRLVPDPRARGAGVRLSCRPPSPREWPALPDNSGPLRLGDALLGRVEQVEREMAEVSARLRAVERWA